MTATDFEVCNQLASTLFARYSDIFSETLKRASSNEKIVVRTWHFFGIVGGGGFEEVFSQDVFGSAGYKAVEQDFRVIGAERAADLVAQAVSINKSMIGCSKKEREVFAKQLSELDSKFYAEDDTIPTLLAAFIRKHF